MLCSATTAARQAAQLAQAERKREELRQRREEKERLRALKNNDEAKYLSLVAQTKNQRLKDLLAQTDEVRFEQRKKERKKNNCYICVPKIAFYFSSTYFQYLRRLGAMVALERLEDYDKASEAKLSIEERSAAADKRAKEKGFVISLNIIIFSQQFDKRGDDSNFRETCSAELQASVDAAAKTSAAADDGQVSFKCDMFFIYFSGGFWFRCTN